MKTLKAILLMLTINTVMTAQEENYKGPAKMYVSTFWRQVEVFKSGKGSQTNIGNMQKAIAGVKEKDPTYNTSEMEDELKKWKAEMQKKSEFVVSEEQQNSNKKIEDVGYNGPAKSRVDYFWKYASKPTDHATDGELGSRIYEMEYALKGTKEKDPSYNTTEMESALNNLKEKRKQMKLAGAGDYHGDKSQPATVAPISNNAGVLFEELFENESLQLGSTSQLSKAPSKVETYRIKTNKLLSMNYSDAKIEHMRMSMGSINGLMVSTEREIAKIDEQLNKFRSKDAMEYSYYNMQLHLAFWDAAQTVFSEESSYKEMYLKVAEAVNKLGTLESLSAKAETNSSEYIKNTVLPKPVVKDVGLEKILMDGFNKKFASQYKVNALLAVLTQDGWTTLRNSLTAEIIGRERSAKLAYKGSDGKCYVLIDYVFIHEEYIAGSFTNTKAVYTGLDGKEILCENVK